MSRFQSRGLSLFKKTITLALIVTLVLPQSAAAAVISNRSLATSPDAQSGLLLYYSFDGPNTTSSLTTTGILHTLFATISSFVQGVGKDVTQVTDIALAPILVAHAVDLSPTVPTITISSFSAYPVTISKGDSSTLSWSQSGATKCYLDNSLGDVGGASVGSVNVFSTTQTTYTLTCLNDSYSATASATVYVRTPTVVVDSSGNSRTGAFYSKPPSLTVFAATSTTWTVPSDWNSSSNTIEAIGGGGGGAGSSGTTAGGGGGGGGGYAKATNVAFTPGATVGVQIGAGGAGGANTGGNGSAGTDTYLCNSTSNCASITGTAVKVGAKGGAGGVYNSSGGAGGVGTSGVGTTKYSGGAGGARGGTGGGGGGGAGGPNGTGGAGGTGATIAGGGGGGGGGGSAGGNATASASGGAGGNNSSGAGGGPQNSEGSVGGGAGGGYGGGYYAYPGGSGQEWGNSRGSGGGAAGAGSTLYAYNATGGIGGSYGAGGGGGAASTNGVGTYGGGNGGNGAPGIVAMTYAPTTWSAVAAQVVSGKMGQAFYFDGGSKEYVSTSTGTSISGVKTVSFWAKAAGSGASQGLVNLAGTTAYISTNASKVISATGFTSPTYYMDGVASSTPGLYDSNWHQIVVTTTSAITATKLQIGAANSVYFTGTIDDFRLYSTVLAPGTASRLTALGSNTAINKTIKTSTLTDGSTLAVHYTLDGPDTSSSSATDRSGNSRTGTLHGSPIVTPGKVGQALSFNGTSGYISEASSVSGIQTISFWAKAAGSGASQGLANITGTTVYVSTNASKVISATGFTSPTYYMDGVASSTPGLYDSNWHLVTITSTAAKTGSQIEVGRGHSTYFNGTIDDFRLYTAVISQAAITRLYNQGAVAFVVNAAPKVTAAADGSALLLYYTFDGPDMQNGIVDKSGNGRTGLLNGGVATTTLLTTASTTNLTWSVPADWNSSNNMIQVIGAGGGGGAGYASNYGGTGGGGGAFSEILDISLTPSGSATYRVGVAGASGGASNTAGTAGGDSWFNGSTLAGSSVGAKGGGGAAAASSNTGGSGGSSASGVGQVKTSGGAGGVRTGSSTAGAGGGGAGGLFGAGNTGGSSSTGNVSGGGGSGDAGYGGAGGASVSAAGTTGPVGGNGSELPGGIGSGGGGAGGAEGGAYPTLVYGGSGGLYGGGSGGLPMSSVGVASGRQGVISVTYNPSGSVSTTTTPGKIGQALSFDGVSQYVSESASISGIKTVSLWVKPTFLGANQGLVNLTGTSVYISTNSSNVISATGFTSPTYYVDGVASSTPGLYDTGWHMVTVTTNTAVTGSSLKIGRANAPFEGYIDDFRLYSGALSASAVYRLYNRGY